MTNPQRDDGEIRFPAAWSKYLLPRRGKRAGKPVALDEEAPRLMRELLDAKDSSLRKTLERDENREFAAPALDHLEGRPDPRGAAVLHALLTASPRTRPGGWIRPEFDAWVLDHGLPFAVSAVIEYSAITATTFKRGNTLQPHERELQWVPPERVRSNMIGFDDGTAAVRSLLAAASDTEYSAVVEAAESHRDDPIRRVAAMVLFPERDAWVLDGCREYAHQQNYSYTNRLLWQSVSTPEHLHAAGMTHFEDYYLETEPVALLLDGLGVASLPFITETLKRRSRLTAAARKTLLKAIGMIPTDEAVDYLLRHLGEPHVFDAAADAARRFPDRTLRIVARLAAATGEAERPRLAGIARGADTADARSGLSETERAAVDDLLAVTAAVPEAPLADVPPLLASPPWKAKRPKARPVVIEGLAADDGLRIVWAPGEHEQWDTLDDQYRSRMTEQQWRDRAAEADHPRMQWWVAEILAQAPLEVAEPVLERWTGQAGGRTPFLLRRILARFGDAALERVAAHPLAEWRVQEVLLPIVGLAAARASADRLRLKSARAGAAAWLDRHGPEAARLLVPDALGKDRKARDAAETALLHIAVRHGNETVTAAAAHYGPEAEAAVGSLIEADPLEPRGVKVPKPGLWADPAMLPQVLLKGRGTALPAKCVPHLITVLALATPEHPYAGVDVIAEACDAASLRRFSRALFEQWVAVGAPSKDGWALTQLAHFADDETVAMLTPLVRQWPGQSQHKRAVTGLEVLGAIGSESALRAIHGISQKVKFKALKEHARVQIDAIASGLGLSAEQLADRLVPDFGLGDDGALVLDYGPRRFKVGFDERLKPFVADEDGKPRKSLPKPGAKDDELLADEAYKRFARLKKELRGVAADQVERLERAMVAGRAWTAEEFRRFFVEHALTRHLSQRLVWVAESSNERTAFRVAEDRTFTDVDDDAFDLPEDATVRLAHPVHLGGTDIAAWAEVLADYEILQPFDQLSRPVMAFTDEELASGELTRFEGAKVEVGRILGMTKRGWQRAAPEDAGVEPGISYELPGGGYVMVNLDPGVYVGAIAETPDQTLESVFLSRVDSFWRRRDEPRSLPAAIDPVAASEVLSSLARLTGRA